MTDTLIKITVESRNALRRYKSALAAIKDEQVTYSDAIEDLLAKAKTLSEWMGTKKGN